uniref:Uncharacterized protein n=1 Tax=Leersia perrieri TaxID=77586 RepID=A0A0D9UZ02_9ORYZ
MTVLEVGAFTDFRCRTDYFQMLLGVYGLTECRESAHRDGGRFAGGGRFGVGGGREVGQHINVSGPDVSN